MADRTDLEEQSQKAAASGVILMFYAENSICLHQILISHYQGGVYIKAVLNNGTQQVKKNLIWFQIYNKRLSRITPFQAEINHLMIYLHELTQISVLLHGWELHLNWVNGWNLLSWMGKGRFTDTDCLSPQQQKQSEHFIQLGSTPFVCIRGATHTGTIQVTVLHPYVSEDRHALLTLT